MADQILIHISRTTDGDMFRMSGSAGIAVTCEKPVPGAPLSALEPGMVSLRCGTVIETVVCLASIIAAVRHTAPEALPLAMSLSRIMDGTHPSYLRELPTKPEGGG